MSQSTLLIPQRLRRRPDVPLRAVPLSFELADRQIERGIYTVHRGERVAIPVDDIHDPTRFLGQDFWRRSALMGGVHRVGAIPAPPDLGTWRAELLQKMAEADPDATAARYKALLGHDLHIGIFGNLYAKHWHAGWANPFEPESFDAPLDPNGESLNAELRAHIRSILESCRPDRYERAQAFREEWLRSRGPLIDGAGFVEQLGWLSGAKVTDAFVSEIIDEMTSATGTEFADFDHHEVGTDSTAENNDHTALQVTSGIARVAGTPTDSDPIYQTVATITADATETWQEHGVFNNTTGPALLDRSLTGGQAVNSSDQVQYTYQLTVNPEA